MENETKSTVENCKKIGFQLSDIVWARTDNTGEIFWPAKICEDEQGMNSWQLNGQVHVQFFLSSQNNQSGMKIRNRWVTVNTDVVPFEKAKDFMIFHEESMGRAYIKAVVRLQKRYPEGQKWKVSLKSQAVGEYMKIKKYSGQENGGNITSVQSKNISSGDDLIAEGRTETTAVHGKEPVESLSGAYKTAGPNMKENARYLSVNYDNVKSIQTELQVISDNKLVPSAGKHPNDDKNFTFNQLLKHMLEELQKKDKDNIFAEPVPFDLVPDYLDVITNPMDFYTMNGKIKDEMYPTLRAFQTDLELICRNAMRYNKKNTIFYQEAKNLLKYGQKIFIPQNVQKIISNVRLNISISSEQLGFEINTSLTNTSGHLQPKRNTSQVDDEGQVFGTEKSVKRKKNPNTDSETSQKKAKFPNPAITDFYQGFSEEDNTTNSLRQTRRANGIDKSINSVEMLSELSRQQAKDYDQGEKQKVKRKRLKKINKASPFKNEVDRIDRKISRNTASEDSGIVDDINEPEEKIKKRRSSTKIIDQNITDEESTIEYSDGSNIEPAIISETKKKKIASSKQSTPHSDRDGVGYTKDQVPIKDDQRYLNPYTDQLTDSTDSYSQDERIGEKPEKDVPIKEKQIKKLNDSTESPNTGTKVATEKEKRRRKKKENRVERPFSNIQPPYTSNIPAIMPIQPMAINLPTEPLPNMQMNN